MQVVFLQSSTKSTHVEPFRRYAPERLICITPRRSGMAHVLKGSHSFTCTPWDNVTWHLEFHLPDSATGAISATSQWRWARWVRKSSELCK